MDQHRDDQLFGKIALNKHYIRRDLLTRAIQYQRAHEPSKRLGEILLEKRILSREQVDDVLAYQSRIRQLTSQTGSHGPQHQQPQQGFPPDSGRMPMATGISQGPPMLLNETASSPAADANDSD